jgi:tetratricopeptide (TPR) repeat protein
MMVNTQRGLHLYQQNRYADAEREFRQAVSNDPDDAYTRAMLGLALSQQERFDEAEREIAEALKIDPGFAFVHYAHAIVLDDRHRYAEAEKSVREAISMDPEVADFYALLAQVRLNQRNWPGALEAAETGLQLDSEHVGCTNLRAMALVNLGRKEEAGLTINAALARNPENSVTHANQGWALLHAGDHNRALEHFRESLRLDPENEWARQGIIEALKAQNFLYAWMLKYFLWMSRLSEQLQWVVILGGFLGMRILRAFSDSNPEWKPYVLPIQILYLIFVFLTWTADPLFNLLLRVNKFGRMVLNREEITASNWVGSFVGLALVCLGLAAFGIKDFLFGAMVFGFSVVPLAAVFKCQPGWPRRAMTGYTAVVAASGIGMFTLLMFSGGLSEENRVGAVVPLMIVFFGGVLLSGWVANILISRRPIR